MLLTMETTARLGVGGLDVEEAVRTPGGEPSGCHCDQLGNLEMMLMPGSASKAQNVVLNLF